MSKAGRGPAIFVFNSVNKPGSAPHISDVRVRRRSSCAKIENDESSKAGNWITSRHV